MITVVMPYLKEGNNPAKTAESIRKYSDCEIIAVNDGGTPCDFGKLGVNNYNLPIRMGVGSSRNIGVSLSHGDKIVIIDAHMKFESGWDALVEEKLDKNPQTIYCFKGKKITPDWKDIKSKMYGTGATIKLKKDNQILVNDWLFGEEEIPMVLGGITCLKKDWFEHLKGYEPMGLWGTNEFFISLKSWLAGGRCECINDIKIGHLYKKKFEYPINWDEVYYNKLTVLYTLFPTALKANLINYMHWSKSFKKAHLKIRKNIEVMRWHKEYNDSIKKMDINEYFKKFDI